MPIESRSPTAYGRYPALSRRRLGVFSYVSELCAGERLRLAGYSSGTGVCARGGCSVRLCVPATALCPRLTPDFAFLSRRFAIGSRLSFSSLRKKRRLAVSCVPVPPDRDRHSHVLQCWRGYLPLAGSLWGCAFICGDLDGSTTGVRLYEKKRRIGWALLSL